MAPSEQVAATGLPELLKDATLAGEWMLNPSRSTVALRNKSIWGLAPVHGVFRQVTGTGTVSPTGDVTGTFTVAAASVNTRNARRDKHLRSPDFFDSGNYPDITFTVARIQPSGPAITVSGMLSVRDRVRPLTFNAAAAIHDDGELWLDAAVVVNQAEFGLNWNFLGMVSMNTTITVHAVFTRRYPSASDG